MLDVIKNNLIVSCQALEDEPLHSPFIMGRMARAAKEGGAVAIRAQGVDDIIEIKRVTNLPVIGIIKRNYKDSEVFITPTEKEIKELIETGCEMIALDATNRTRPNNEKIKDLLELIHKSKRLAMADISTYEEGIKAQEMGFDCISTTLSGYTSYSTQSDKVDFKLLEELVKDCSIPVICEGRIYTPEELKEAFDIGAYSVVIGGAITRPQQITERFVKAIK
ncbi:N-acetylmannosamine-6-phosphate 2-epimerase [Clostridium baratii]|uniref:N-acetylmannosamine-6-phosphate 2-epimerase n=1 Tax=Clostridium baratii TaxID=1561 RepID=UPI0005F29493|nr:N-acetylmannosamine-6-phosphate 2-epimerase [Clostridium baratii]AQM60078.1 N-acetylmannosamine-6-phosphate 2-epimerase [Clostridium baratii]KJU72963.1 N-acetylmannosamine-6-phosphate 2-epimerase [Clostridium baratii]MBS6041839.1 N-acetylmannosamine-6-phosphate 2-epimerase [Clostridium baratii]MBT9831586.1 putative N-acetylmannosamine-6-phosphate 2-epimerase [Clostridium baratii]STB00011.1 N-acetylmannosamine-6-phosphate 2-epimerase [Clostridium baratii]